MRQIKKHYFLEKIINIKGMLRDTFFNSFMQNEKDTIKLIQTAETGRSMVEILGVLAVIGVLSVGGIMGYRFAMDKYRANDIVNEVNMRSTDIWNRYQEIPLPDYSEDDTSDFPEYAELTNTGFPIVVKSFPDVAFRILVSNVPSGVCKQVLNMNLENGITGLQYVQVNDVKYAGTTTICGENETDNELIFTSFLDSETKEDNVNHCVADTDCPICCGSPICNEETLTCESRCSDDQYCLCNEDNTSGTCVECITPENCASKGERYTCSELNHKCVEIPEICVEGEQFRSKNGVCIDCTSPNNHVVSTAIFEVAALNIRDETSGYQQCQSCQRTRYTGIMSEADETAYCSYACTKNYSFQSLNDGCISCTDPAKADHTIATDDVSLQQCLACPNHIWYRHQAYDYQTVCGPATCPAGQFKGLSCSTCGSLPFECRDCSDPAHYYIGEYIYTNTGYTTRFKEMCEQCPQRRFYDGWCVYNCTQPENTEESITICQNNPSDPNCTRKFQGSNRVCYACNTDAIINIGTDEFLTQLCEQCGRKVQDGQCIQKTLKKCPLGEFLSVDGRCVSCTTTWGVSVLSDADSGCTANCRKNEQGEYDLNGTTETHWILPKENKLPLCVQKCKDTQFQSTSGYCIDCDSETRSLEEVAIGKIPELENMCRNNCSEERTVINERCASNKPCSPNPDGSKRWPNRHNVCLQCSQKNHDWVIPEPYKPNISDYDSFNQKRIQMCEDCGNRIYLNQRNDRTFCILVDPGVSGVCNSVNTTLPATLDADLVQKSQPYINGAYDGRLWRDIFGLCHPCDYENTIESMPDQCGSCDNRRYANGKCAKGRCEAGSQFLRMSDSTCVSCTAKNVAIDPNKENLCSNCDNRRQLETGNPATHNWEARCVELCAGTQWQDIDGNCLLCEEGGTRDIGTDFESRRLCNQCDNRTAVVKDIVDDVAVSYRCEVIE